MSSEKTHSRLVLFFSLLAVYTLAPDLNRSHGHIISTSFALLLILNSGYIGNSAHFFRFFAFVGIYNLGYFLLFQDQPWDFLFEGGTFESTTMAPIICSLIFSTAGWLFIKSWPKRMLYLFLTSGIQIPIAMSVATPEVEMFLTNVSNTLWVSHEYHAAWQAWQFEWMLTHLLAMHFLSRRRR